MKNQVVASLFTLYIASREVDILKDEFTILQNIDKIAKMFNVEDEYLTLINEED